jgi:hypothetical protein
MKTVHGVSATGSHGPGKLCRWLPLFGSTTAVAATRDAAGWFVAIRYCDLVMMAEHTREPGGFMDLKGLQRKAKQLIDRRGGTDSLKADAEELTDIAKGPGSVADKAKRAGEALKDPGARGPDAPPAPHPSATDSPASPAPDR